MDKRNHCLIVINIILTVVLIITISAVYNRTEDIEQREEDVMLMYENVDKLLYEVDEKIEELNTIEQLSEQYNIAPELILAMIKVESNFNQYAISSEGCSGYLQISPIHNVANVFDLNTNLEWGLGYFSTLLNESQDLHIALGEYNRGRTGYAKYVENTGNKLTAYSEKVVKYLNELQPW